MAKTVVKEESKPTTRLVSKEDGKTIVSLVTSNIGTLLLVVAAFFLGALVTENRYLKAGGGPSAAPAAGAAAAAAPAAAGTATAVSLDTIKGLFSGKYISFGDANRKVLFVEVADPSCPYCHVAGGEDGALNKAMGAQFTLTADGGTYDAPVPEMKKLVDAGKASFVYIYSPGHGNGEMGARALYCAQEKGKFWQVHDLMMSEKGYEIQNGTDASQQPTTGPIVKNDKTKAGDLANFLKDAIDPNFMKDCLSNGKYDSRLTSDTAEATALGIQGTPGFFVNTTNYAGAYSWTDMKSTVDAALQ